MISLKYAIPAMAVLSGAPVFACSYPASPAAMPDGSSASKEMMMAKKREVDRYKLEVHSYIACEPDPRRKTWARVDLEDVSRRFNNSVRAFKRANNEG